MISVNIIESPLRTKKLRALFFKDGKYWRKTDFGAKGYEDYTTHHDNERKERYINRHRDKEDWNNPFTAGSLSRWILWNKKDLHKSIKDYTKIFDFKLM